MVNWHRKIWKIQNSATTPAVLFNSTGGASNEFWLSPLAEGACFVLVSEPGQVTESWQKRILFPRGAVAFNSSNPVDEDTERLESLPNKDGQVLQLYFEPGEPEKLTARLIVLGEEPDGGLAIAVPP